ncbi:uncharacterized protein LOC102800652 [Saccoglossus kowalevskii]|uniref:Early growth response protein 1-like n=1 Tax=Saccoglossus kowalevskii TaxID=10224 RepID=A0ABM0N134_SACKO|nr:PREDICTED: early growth response protein 1-like [Saccoglossus kowalevskii]
MEHGYTLSAGRIFRPTIVYQCPDVHVEQAPSTALGSAHSMYLCPSLHSTMENSVVSSWWSRTPPGLVNTRSDYYDPPSYIACNNPMCLPRWVTPEFSKTDFSSRPRLFATAPSLPVTKPVSKEFSLLRPDVILSGNCEPINTGSKSDTLTRLKEFVNISHGGVDPVSITEVAAGGTLEENTRSRDEKKMEEKRRRFPCPICDVSCSNNGQLRGHIRVHTGERPFKCDNPCCGRAFARNEELTRHKRIHTGLRPHRCTICNKRFGRKDHLTKHIKTHLKPAEKKTYVCEMFGCGQKYSRSDALARHQWTAHSVKPKSNCRKNTTPQQ